MFLCYTEFDEQQGITVKSSRYPGHFGNTIDTCDKPISSYTLHRHCDCTRIPRALNLQQKKYFFSAKTLVLMNQIEPFRIKGCIFIHLWYKEM